MFVPFIKVCGIQTLEEALGAVEAGANTLGFLVGLTHLAEDKISAESAKSIIEKLPAGVRTVMVTHLLNPYEISDMAEEMKVSAVQIHDDMPLNDLELLRGLLPFTELIKAVHVMGVDAVEHARQYEEIVDMLLLDSRTKDRLGGTGMTHDWNISREIVEESRMPVILAGGLKPENVEEAIEKVKPAGIDANSGLEHPDGTKDFEKIRIYAEAGRICTFQK